MLSFHVKFVQTDGYGQTSTVKQHAPDLLIRGNKNKALFGKGLKEMLFRIMRTGENVGYQLFP